LKDGNLAMVEVKIFIAMDYSDYDDYNSRTVLANSISDWEEITEAEFEFLQRNLHHLYNNKSMGRLVLIRKDEATVTERITSIKASLKKIKDEEDRKKKEADLKKAKRLAAKKNKDLETLQKLKEKYPDDV
jgi:hypothetical protein